jgi:hypothetical protein
MIKNKFITSLLLLAFTIVFAHSVIPHHHYDVNSSEFAFSSENHDEENSLQHSFELYDSFGSSSDYFIKHDFNYSPFLFLNDCVLSCFNFSSKTIDLSTTLCFVSTKVSLPSTFLYSKGLRGPPQV